MSVIIEYWDEDQERLESFLLLDIVDEKLGVAKGIIGGANLTEEQAKYEEGHKTVHLKDFFLYRLRFDTPFITRTLTLNVSGKEEAWRKILFAFRRSKAAEGYVATQPLVPIKPEVSIYHATLLTSSDELDEGTL